MAARKATRSKARAAWQNAGEGRLVSDMAELIGRFGSEEACEEHMISLRWPGGFRCERCGHGSYARVSGRREFRCRECGWQFSATSGTAIAHTMLPLAKWFRAAWLLCSGRRGVSAQDVARECHVSDATGGSMLSRLRAAMSWSARLVTVGGPWVEADATSVNCGNSAGGPRGAGSGLRDVPVMGAVSASLCCLRAVSDVTAGSVSEFFASHVSRLREVRVDDHPSHAQALPGGWDAVVRGSAADGDSEASLPAAHHVFSNLKAKLEGTHHGVTWPWLQAYLDEFSWAYCHRSSDPFADLLSELARWPHVPIPRLRRLFAPQAPHEGALDPGYRHNRYIEAKRLSQNRRELVTDLSSVAALKAAHLTRL